MRPCSLAFCFALLMISVTPKALAYEDQVSVAIDVGYGLTLANDVAPPHAVAFGLSSTYGISDAWALTGRLGYQLHPSADTGALHAAGLNVEVVYVVDILKFVPFFGLGVDAFLTKRSIRPAAFALGFHAVVGFDYLLSRNVLVGFDARLTWVPLTEGSELKPLVLNLGLRIGFLFDLF